MQTRVLSGQPAVAALADLSVLHEAAAVPVTAGATWLTAWAQARGPSGTELRLVLVEDSAGVAGAAALAVLRRGPLTRVLAWGHGDSDDVRLPARADAAEALAAAVTADLGRLAGPWTLSIEQLLIGDPVAAGLAARLGCAHLVPGDGAPVTAFGPDRSYPATVSRNGRRAVNQGRNRLARAGLAPVYAVARTPAEVAALLPQVQRLRRGRDHECGRPAGLDEPRRLAFYRGVLHALAEEGRLELSTAQIDGHLAAYVVALRDGAWLRLWDGRFDPAWSEYGLGRVLDAEVLTRALEDPTLRGVDWMRGEEDYKARAATSVVPHEHLQAWSSPAVRAALGVVPAARAALRQQLVARPEAYSRWVGLKRTVLERQAG